MGNPQRESGMKMQLDTHKDTKPQRGEFPFVALCLRGG
jgi:hypothetical protein